MEDGNNNNNENSNKGGTEKIPHKPQAEKTFKHDDVGTSAKPYEQKYQDALRRIEAEDDKFSLSSLVERGTKDIEARESAKMQAEKALGAGVWMDIPGKAPEQPKATAEAPKLKDNEVAGGALENWFIGLGRKAAQMLDNTEAKAPKAAQKKGLDLSSDLEVMTRAAPLTPLQQKAAEKYDQHQFKDKAVGGPMEKAVRKHGIKFFVAMAISTVAGGLLGRAMQEPRMGQTSPEREGVTEVSRIRAEEVPEVKVEATLADQVNGLSQKVARDAKRMAEAPLATANVKHAAPAEMTALGPEQGVKIKDPSIKGFDGGKSMIGDFAKSATKLSDMGMSAAPNVAGPHAKEPAKTGPITPTRVLTIDELKK